MPRPDTVDIARGAPENIARGSDGLLKMIDLLRPHQMPGPLPAYAHNINTRTVGTGRVIY